MSEQHEPSSNPPKPPLKIFLATVFVFPILLVGLLVWYLAIWGWRTYPPQETFHVVGGDPDRGRLAIVEHGCGGCHTIPQIPGAHGKVGPPLEGFAQRMYIGGQLPNTPENLVAWIQNPRRYAPGTAMPNLNISEPKARDIAAFLYTP